MEHKYIKFTGDYSKLKTMDYEFQKLYAGNYMQWCNDGTRIWKKGGDVTIDRLTNFEGSFFEKYLAEKPEPWGERSKAIRVITNREDGTVTFDYNVYIEMQKRLFADPENASYDHECVLISTRMLAPLDKLIELGWVELGVWEGE